MDKSQASPIRPNYSWVLGKNLSWPTCGFKYERFSQSNVKFKVDSITKQRSGFWIDPVPKP